MLLLALPLVGWGVAVWSSQLILPIAALLGLIWLFWCVPALRPQELVLRLDWWQVIWLLMLASGFVFRARTITDAADNPLDSAAMVRVGIMAMATACLQFAIIGRKIEVISSLFRGLFLFMTLFNILNIVSYVWSINPGWTLYRSFEHTMDVVVVVAIAATLNDTAGYRKLFNWTWMLMALLLGTVALSVLVAPGRAIDHGVGVLGISVEGVYPLISRNAVGMFGALLAIVAIARLATSAGNPRLYWGVLLIGTGVMFISQTRSAVAPMVLTTPIVLFAANRLRLTFALPLLVVGALMMTNVGHDFSSYWQRNETSGQLRELNGRLNYWEYSWQITQKRPLTGYGAFAGGRFAVASAVGHDTLSSTHGTYTEVLVGTGFPGVMLLLIILGGVGFYIGRSALFGKRDTPEERAAWVMSIEALGALLLVTGHSIFDVDLIWHPSLAFLALMAYAEFLRRGSRVKREGLE